MLSRSNHRTLFIHVGHPKTGSSFLQSTLAVSQDALSAAGIHYPAAQRFKAAAAGMISSGNGRLIEAYDGCLPEATDGANHVLFSGERLFAMLLNGKALANVKRVAEEVRADRIEFLLFIRNPIGHLASVYQQRVKRRGVTQSIDAFARTYTYPQRAAAFLRLFEDDPRVTVHVCNYDRVKNALRTELAQFLGLREGVLRVLPRTNVNRSLSEGEFYLQRALNAAMGASGEYVAMPLCNQIPDGVPGVALAPSRAVQEEIIAANAAAMEEVNGKIDTQHAYVADFAEPCDGTEGSFTFTAAQLDVIAKAIGRRTRKLREQLEQGAT